MVRLLRHALWPHNRRKEDLMRARLYGLAITVAACIPAAYLGASWSS